MAHSRARQQAGNTSAGCATANDGDFGSGKLFLAFNSNAGEEDLPRIALVRVHLTYYMSEENLVIGRSGDPVIGKAKKQ
jgi:hypothetical protein